MPDDDGIHWSTLGAGLGLAALLTILSVGLPLMVGLVSAWLAGTGGYAIAKPGRIRLLMTSAHLQFGRMDGMIWIVVMVIPAMISAVTLGLA